VLLRRRFANRFVFQAAGARRPEIFFSKTRFLNTVFRIAARAARRRKREHAMRALIGTTLLLSAALWAQTGAVSTAASETQAAASRVHGPTYSQLYCSGFITRKEVPRSAYVLGSKESPNADRLQGRSLLFLRGDGLAEGGRYSIIRQVADPNREDSSPEERQKLGTLGALYEDIGWVTVRSIENGTSIASFDFACGAAIPGDILIPFEERPQVAFRSSIVTLPTFLGARPGQVGHILGARDFQSLLGDGTIVYTDFGSESGARPGDYLMVTRGYAPGDLNKVDRIADVLPRGAEATALSQVPLPADAGSQMPIHVLGEMVILNVSEKSSTALITNSRAEMQLGDVVQAESGAEQAKQ